jgi:radical SAM superfamily enzyme YgiQ (UPF0313 family)
MKVAVGYPPLKLRHAGVPLLSQNRQYQIFHSPTFIYPMVPAYAASNLQAHGYEVVWMDGIAARQSYEEFLAQLEKERPDVLLVESKAPVIKRHWEVIAELKEKFPELILVWVGDHVTWAPLETLDNSPVDFVIAGGDYDFVIVNLLEHIRRGAPLEGGVWFREGDGHIKNQEQFAVHTSAKGKRYRSTGPISLQHNLDELPFVDRDLTRWELYAYNNGNYKYLPGTYMYSGRDCWWNRCTFCVWDHTLNPVGTYRSFSPQRLLDEVGHVLDHYPVREIFDDAGTLRVGPWLQEFCQGMIERGYHKRVVYGCNMRLNAIRDQATYDLMKKANFRFILYGMESGNQETLDRLDKGLKVEQIEEGVRLAKKAGLEPHLTVMMGYPWETYEDARRTVKLAADLFRKGYVDTLQGTVVIPYPGTPLWKECQQNGWLLSEDYGRYDMREPVMKTPISREQIMELTQELYRAFLSPQYFWRKITSIRSWDDVKFLLTSGVKLVGHLLDFNKGQLPSPAAVGGAAARQC